MKMNRAISINVNNNRGSNEDDSSKNFLNREKSQTVFSRKSTKERTRTDNNENEYVIQYSLKSDKDGGQQENI